MPEKGGGGGRRLVPEKEAPPPPPTSEKHLQKRTTKGKTNSSSQAVWESLEMGKSFSNAELRKIAKPENPC